MKTFLIGIASLAALASPIAASAQSWNHGGGYGGYHASNGYRGGGYGGGYGRGYDRRGDGAGLAIGAGVLGLVAGAALASSHHDYDDRRYGYGYDNGYGYGYGRCYLQSQPVYGPYGDVEYQQVRVCR